MNINVIDLVIYCFIFSRLHFFEHYFIHFSSFFLIDVLKLSITGLSSFCMAFFNFSAIGVTSLLFSSINFSQYLIVVSLFWHVF